MEEQVNAVSISPVRSIALVIGFMVAAIAFALFFLPQSLRLDEAQSLWESSRSAGAILTVVAQDVHVPLYHELLRAWRTTVGDTVQSARLLSILFFVLAIPALYFLGRKAYGEVVGLFATALFVLSPFMNWYGSEIRMYTLFTLLAIVHQYCYLGLMRERKWYYWLGYVSTAIAGIYTHYFFFLILFTEAVYYFIRMRLFPRGSFVRFVLSWIAVVLSFVPWVLYVLYQGEAQNQQPVLPIPSTINLASVFSQFLFGFQIDPINTIILSLWPIIIILVFLGLRDEDESHPETVFFIMSALLPVVLAFIISFLVPLFVSRYLIFVVPTLYLLIARLFSRYSRGIGMAVGGSLAALMFCMLGIQATSAATPVKEDYLGVANYLASHASVQDAIIVSAPFTIYPLEYYYRGPVPLATLPSWNRYEHGAIPSFDEKTLPDQVQQETNHANYAWVVLSYDQGYQAKIKTYFDEHYALVYSKQFSPNLTLYAYKIRYDTIPLNMPDVETGGAPSEGAP